MLILYGLHPEDLETRVVKAVDRIRPQLRKQGCEVELLGVNDGVIRVRVETGSHTCGSTAKTVQATLEGAIYDAAPDLSFAGRSKGSKRSRPLDLWPWTS